MFAPFAPQRPTDRTRPPEAPLASVDRLIAAGRLDEARGALEKMIAANPSSAPAHDRLGFVLGKQGATAEAIGEFRTAVSLDPKLADAQYHLGATLWWTKDIEAAREAVEGAVKVPPPHPRSRCHLGLTES